NERIISDLDVESYLKSMVAKINRSGWLRLDTGEEIEFEDRFLSGINHGTEVRINGNPVPDGRYKTEKDNLILYIRNSMVYRIFKTTTFSTDRGDISFHEVANREIPIHKKMKVWSGENLVADGRYVLNANERKLKFIEVKDGLISKIKYE